MEGWREVLDGWEGGRWFFWWKVGGGGPSGGVVRVEKEWEVSTYTCRTRSISRSHVGVIC